MAKRKPKPDPVADPSAAEAEAHARADAVTDPAAFEFPIPPAAGDAPAHATAGGNHHPTDRDARTAAGDATPTTTVVARSVRPAREREETRRMPDPFPLAAITLGAEKDSPRVRLFRSDRFKQVAIRFDEKPDPKYLDQLRDAGFRWRSDDGVWTKQFDADRRWQSVAEAEQLFARIGNALRADLGLEPVRLATV